MPAPGRWTAPRRRAAGAACPRCECAQPSNAGSPGTCSCFVFPQAEIKANYYKLSRLVHPDKCSHPRAGDAAAVLNQVGLAWAAAWWWCGIASGLGCCLWVVSLRVAWAAARGFSCRLWLHLPPGALAAAISDCAAAHCTAAALHAAPAPERNSLLHPAAPCLCCAPQAWDTLSNPIKKRAYDAYGKRGGALVSRLPPLCCHEPCRYCLPLLPPAMPSAAPISWLRCAFVRPAPPRAVDDINVDAPEGMTYAEWEASNVGSCGS